MAKNNPFFLRITTLGLLVTPLAVFAADSDAIFPYDARVLASGTAATGESIFAADGMLPVFTAPNGFLFGDLSGGYATDSSYVVSPGSGYRNLANNQVLGAYLFGDYQRTSVGGDFWDLSPGVEWITPRWDAHANLYFPTSTSQQAGSTVFADTVGGSSKSTFSGHTEISALATPYAVIGNGGDLELGFSLPGMKNLRTRIYAGAYYYAPTSVANSIDSTVTSITGVTGGVEVPLTQYFSVAVRNSYDNVTKNTAALSLSFTFGGSSNILSDDVHDRLLDPIERHVGIIGTGAGTYAQKDYAYTGASAVEYSNVYFVSPTGTDPGSSGDFATYENAGLLDQDTINAINVAQGSTGTSRIYIEGDSGTYTIDSATTNSGAGLQVYAGQDFYGRTANYAAPAASGHQPLINVDVGLSGFVTNGGENTFSDMSLVGAGSASGLAAINIQGAGLVEDETVTINNTNISNFTGSAGSTAGVVSINASTGYGLTLNIKDSVINGNQWGLYTANGSTAEFYTVNIMNSTVNENTDGGMYILSENGGLPGESGFTLNAMNSQFNNNGLQNGGALSGNDYLAGVYAQNQGSTPIIINAVNSQFNENGIAANGYAGSGDTPTAGIIARNNGTGEFIINSANSQFNGNGVVAPTGSTAHVDGVVAGIYAENFDTGALTIDAVNSQFNGNGVANDGNIHGPVAGIYALNDGTSGTLNISAVNSQFVSNGLVTGTGSISDTVAGLYLDDQTSSGISAVTDLIGSLFDNNGGYGVYGIAAQTNIATINYTRAYFSGSAQTNDTNKDESGNNVTWIN